jgi:hypothetical protein
MTTGASRISRTAADEWTSRSHRISQQATTSFVLRPLPCTPLTVVVDSNSTCPATNSPSLAAVLLHQPPSGSQELTANLTLDSEEFTETWPPMLSQVQLCTLVELPRFQVAVSALFSVVDPSHSQLLPVVDSRLLWLLRLPVLSNKPPLPAPRLPPQEVPQRVAPHFTDVSYHYFVRESDNADLWYRMWWYRMDWTNRLRSRNLHQERWLLLPVHSIDASSICYQSTPLLNTDIDHDGGSSSLPSLGRGRWCEARWDWCSDQEKETSIVHIRSKSLA